MELIYIYIDKYRNYKETELLFGDRFNIKYDKDSNNLSIERNNKNQNIYPSCITNVNAIVGRNSVGKTNLIDLIGMKIYDRQKNNAEYEIIYKKKNTSGFRYPDDIEKEIQHAQYFLVFYLGVNNENEDLFCFEGNNIKNFEKIINDEISYSDYFYGKGWFSIVCTYKNNVLKYKYNINEKIGEYTGDNGCNIYGDYRKEQDKLAIISFRNNLNSEIYDRISLKPKDEYKIAIPRRVARLRSHLWINQIKVLQFLMNKEQENKQKDNKETMFSDTEYRLEIKYYDTYIDKEEMFFSELSPNIDEEYKNKCEIIESFIKYIYSFQLSESEQKNVKSNLCKINLQTITYNDAICYYGSVIDSLLIEMDAESKNFFKREFMDFVDILNNKYITLTNKSIDIIIKKDTNIKNIEKVIDILLDRDYKNSVFEEMFAIFNGFFECVLKNLSDGEINALGIYASILEQISDSNFNFQKEKFILLFDEPEANMHPELARNFINDIVTFLEKIGDNKKFQLIISTHSPFILSDILPCNVLFLNKKNYGLCEVQSCEISTFSANIHDMLSNGFFMNSTIGEYSKRKINQIIYKLFDDRNKDITKEEKNEIKYIISNIGEPILRSKLQHSFYEKYHEEELYDTKNEILNSIQEVCKSSDNIKEIKHRITNLLDNIKE